MYFETDLIIQYTFTIQKCHILKFDNVKHYRITE